MGGEKIEIFKSLNRNHVYSFTLFLLVYNLRTHPAVLRDFHLGYDLQITKGYTGPTLANWIGNLILASKGNLLLEPSDAWTIHATLMAIKGPPQLHLSMLKGHVISKDQTKVGLMQGIFPNHSTIN